MASRQLKNVKQISGSVVEFKHLEDALFVPDINSLQVFGFGFGLVSYIPAFDTVTEFPLCLIHNLVQIYTCRCLRQWLI